jgi:hypothetical protein
VTSSSETGLKKAVVGQAGVDAGKVLVQSKLGDALVVPWRLALAARVSSIAVSWKSCWKSVILKFPAKAGSISTEYEMEPDVFAPTVPKNATVTAPTVGSGSNVNDAAPSVPVIAPPTANAPKTLSPAATQVPAVNRVDASRV